jgi:hypothetical protein
MVPRADDGPRELGYELGTLLISADPRLPKPAIQSYNRRMPKRPTEIGPAGERTARAIERVRTARGYAQRQLADRATALGRPMTITTVSRIERRRRRCDVDDLVAIAAALGVSPLALFAETEAEPA